MPCFWLGFFRGWIYAPVCSSVLLCRWKDFSFHLSHRAHRLVSGSQVVVLGMCVAVYAWVVIKLRSWLDVVIQCAAWLVLEVVCNLLILLCAAMCPG